MTATLTPYSPFEMRLIRLIRDIQDEIGGLVSSTRVASKLSLPQRTVRYYVKRLEAEGLLSRPDGPRAGYSALNGAACSLSGRDSLAVHINSLDPLDFNVLRLLNSHTTPLTAPALRDLLKTWHRQTIWTHLKRLESIGLVHRPGGPRSGYAIREPQGLHVYARLEASQLCGRLSPFLMRILREVRDHQRHCTAVSSRYLAQQLATAERSMRYYLRQLVKANCLQRKNGLKGGYHVSDVGAALLELEARYGTAHA